MSRPRFAAFAAPIVLVAVTMLTGVAGAVATNNATDTITLVAADPTPTANPAQTVAPKSATRMMKATPTARPSAAPATTPAPAEAPAPTAVQAPQDTGDVAAPVAAPAPSPTPAPAEPTVTTQAANPTPPAPPATTEQHGTIGNTATATYDGTNATSTASSLDATGPSPIDMVVALDATDRHMTATIRYAATETINVTDLTVTITVDGPMGAHTLSIDVGTTTIDQTPRTATVTWAENLPGDYTATGTYTYRA